MSLDASQKSIDSSQHQKRKNSMLSDPSSPTRNEKPVKQDNDEDEDLDEEKQDQPMERQDLYVCFTNDKDLRHPETISIKA